MFNNIQVFVKGIVIDENNNHVVMLSDKEETKVLPIVIGPVEAMAILMNMQGITPNRPLTHNLLKNLLDLLGAEVEQIIITNIKDNVYYASLYVKHDKYTFEVDRIYGKSFGLKRRSQLNRYAISRFNFLKKKPSGFTAIIS